MKGQKVARIVRSVLVVAGMALALPSLAIVSKSRGVPAGWTENFDEAKEKAAKEGKFILMVSCQSDGYWGADRVKGLWGSARFSGKAKKKYVLMMIDTAKNLSNLSKRAIEQNPKIMRDYDLSSYNDIVILDSDGVVVKRPPYDTYSFGSISPEDLWTKLEVETRELKWPDPKKADKKAKAAQVESKNKSTKTSAAAPDAAPTWCRAAEKLRGCEFLLNRDYKKNAKFYLCLFSASWCPPCRAEMPRIAKTYAETLKNDPDIELIHFSRDQNDEKAMAWGKEHDVKFPVVKPRGGNPLDLHCNGIPHLFIIKANGVLLEEGHPMRLFTEEKLRELKQ